MIKHPYITKFLEKCTRVAADPAVLKHFTLFSDGNARQRDLNTVLDALVKIETAKYLGTFIIIIIIHANNRNHRNHRNHPNHHPIRKALESRRVRKIKSKRSNKLGAIIKNTNCMVNLPTLTRCKLRPRRLH